MLENRPSRTRRGGWVCKTTRRAGYSLREPDLSAGVWTRTKGGCPNGWDRRSGRKQNNKDRAAHQRPSHVCTLCITYTAIILFPTDDPYPEHRPAFNVVFTSNPHFSSLLSKRVCKPPHQAISCIYGYRTTAQAILQVANHLAHFFLHGPISGIHGYDKDASHAPLEKHRRGGARHVRVDCRRKDKPYRSWRRRQRHASAPPRAILLVQHTQGTVRVEGSVGKVQYAVVHPVLTVSTEPGLSVWHAPSQRNRCKRRASMKGGSLPRRLLARRRALAENRGSARSRAHGRAACQ